MHEHAGKRDAEGRFSVAMRFPKPGTYHVYADVVPKGLGQQVVRFEVPVGIATGPTTRQQVHVGATKGSDGPAMSADAVKGSHGSHASHGSQGSHGSHGNPKAAVPAELMLHATPSRAGRYALWIQVKGGDQVRTVPFVVTAPPAP